MRVENICYQIPPVRIHTPPLSSPPRTQTLTRIVVALVSRAQAKEPAHIQTWYKDLAQLYALGEDTSLCSWFLARAGVWQGETNVHWDCAFAF